MSMTKKDKLFLPITSLTSIGLFIFTFWLGFPGFFQTGDIYNSLSVTTDNWHPVIIARVIQGLYFLFGRHSHYLFAINIACFYLGLLLFVDGLYIKTRSMWSYGFFSFTFLGNIYFQNFIEYHSFTFPMLVWLGCSLLFFQIYADIDNKYFSIAIHLFTFLVFFFALLWRHNAILSIFPLTIIFIYRHLNNINPNKPTPLLSLRFTKLFILSGITMTAIIVVIPNLLSSNKATRTTNHIFLHQIAGMVVPANDNTFIPQDWYAGGKDFQDVIDMYHEYPTFADPFNVGWEPFGDHTPFKKRNLDGLKNIWVKGIVTFPRNYLNHISRFIKIMWHQDPGWILNPTEIQNTPQHPAHINIASRFPKNERHIQFSPLQERIYSLQYKNRFVLNQFVGILTGIIVLGVSSTIWFTKSNLQGEGLLFPFCVSLSSFITSIGVSIFSPSTDPRYMSPPFVIALISLIGLISWFSVDSKERITQLTT
jgi:hypothetical protein